MERIPGGPFAEQLARGLSRRRFLSKLSRTAAATAIVLAGGEFVAPSVASALLELGCSFPGGVRCANCPGTGCPAGYSACTTASGCGPCVYATGSWVGHSGYGTCKNGYNRCYDCWNGSCANTCGCGSICLCCTCCSPAEVMAEMNREQNALAAAARA
jgi:hypothetical protein